MVVPVETVAPLLIAAGCIAAPTVFFLGLFRLLDALRDDDLIRRIQAREGFDPSSFAVSLPVLSPDVITGSGVRCPGCGAQNMAEAAFCQQCLRELPR